MPPSATDAAYRDAIARAEADPQVLGAVLVGSRVFGAPMLRDGSDWDVRLIVPDEALEAVVARLGTGHGSPVELAIFRESTFASIGQPGGLAAWDRPSYIRAVLIFDKLDGAIAAQLEALGRLAPGEARSLAATSLDDYVNAYFRSLKNAAVGLAFGAHLDATESIGPLLATLFAIRGRVRPFNRQLEWELEHEPLGGGWLATAALLPRIQGIVQAGTIEDQAALFRDVEALARERGFGDVIDGWEPDVDRLRRGDPAAGQLG